MSAEERTRLAAAERARLIEKFVWPNLQSAFVRYPELNCGALLVAQYWNDEADDAVHGELVFSERTTLDLNAALRSLDAAEALENDDADEARSSVDRVNLPKLQLSQLDLVYELSAVGRLYWNPNGSAISAFASFCAEGANQDMRYSEAYSPYAVFRKDGTMEVVGTMLRPHLDGVTPEWAGR